MNVSKRSESLVNVELNQQYWHWHLHLVVMLQHPVNGLWHVLHNDIQVNLVLLLMF